MSLNCSPPTDSVSESCSATESDRARARESSSSSSSEGGSKDWVSAGWFRCLRIYSYVVLSQASGVRYRKRRGLTDYHNHS